MKKKIHSKIFLIFILITIFLCNSIFPQILERIIPVFPSAADTLGEYANVVFTNKDTGWIYTTLRLIKPYGDCYNKLFRTTDGGKSWEKKILEIGVFDIYRMYTKEPDFLFVVYHGNNILITPNGGSSWDSSKIDEMQSGINKIHFFNERDAIAFSNNRWFTSDGGYSWKKGNVTQKEFLSPSDVCFVNDSLGWMLSGHYLITDVGIIANTTNGGRTWAYQDSITSLLYGVEFIDSLKGFAVGTNRSFSNGYIYKTKDGGKNWEIERYENVGPFWDVSFLDSLYGWISGTGRILRTTDGGETWETQVEGYTASFKQLIMLKKDKTAYVFGDDWNGKTHTLLRADLSNLTEVEAKKETKPKEFLLFNNYPNPFNPTTTISYNLPSDGRVTIKVYDMLGREVKTLVNDYKNAGSYSVVWNSKDIYDNEVSSGIYFYNIRFKDQSYSKKMILVR
ncbi:MAG: YCF48-related protein [Ignavibacteriales bacterium]|nr:YCF48-related protein [Ignavibacteriales bacterium]